MVSLIRKLWTDQVGSSVAAEMAIVTSLTVGALVMTMGQFSASVNREFQESAVQTGLTISDIEKEKEKEDDKARPAKKNEKKADEEKSTSSRFRRAENRE
jgi:uncharacterized NAD-dependent epimerase/dehydratase family protein